jgi:hypothetical protein
MRLESGAYRLFSLQGTANAAVQKFAAVSLNRANRI